MDAEAEITREFYKDAEEKAVQELKGVGKPFIIVLNTKIFAADSDIVSIPDAEIKAVLNKTVTPAQTISKP